MTKKPLRRATALAEEVTPLPEAEQTKGVRRANTMASHIVIKGPERIT